MERRDFNEIQDVAEQKEMIRDAIREFIKWDWKQLAHVGIYEPTISHRIALYLEWVFGQYRVHIDCEYNRAMDSDKYDSKGNKVRPDIIIHERFNKKASYIAFEVKKCSSRSKLGVSDIEKLKRYFGEPLHYRLGVFIGVLKSKIEIVWVVNGNEEKPEIIKK